MSESQGSPILDSTNVFVKYLPPELDHAGFYHLFAPFGTIVSSKIMVDQMTSKSLGYGFVRYRSAESAQRCIDEMNGFQIANKRLLCKFANQSPPNSNPPRDVSLLATQVRSNNIYVKPLLSDTVEADLLELFAPFGEILECKVMVDRNTGMSRQIGFVRFSTEDMAEAAINGMNGHHLSAASPGLIVKFADSKEQKAARYARRYKETPGPPLMNGSPPGAFMPYGFYPYASPYPYPGYVPYSGFAPYPPYSQPSWFYPIPDGSMVIVGAPLSDSTLTVDSPADVEEPVQVPASNDLPAKVLGVAMEASGLAPELA